MVQELNHIQVSPLESVLQHIQLSLEVLIFFLLGRKTLAGRILNKSDLIHLLFIPDDLDELVDVWVGLSDYYLQSAMPALQTVVRPRSVGGIVVPAPQLQISLLVGKVTTTKIISK